jgi:signal transduction histidine kinase
MSFENCWDRTDLVIRGGSGSAEPGEQGGPASKGLTVGGELAALQRISPLVASDHPSEKIFEAVAHEMAQLTNADGAWLVHFAAGDSIMLLGTWPPVDRSRPIGTRQEISDELRLARDAAVPYRVDTLDPEATGPFVEEALRLKIVSSLGLPIFLHGQVWGLGAVTLLRQESFSEGHEASLERFLELAAPALGSSQALAEKRHTVDGQRAFSRVAELASRDAASDELFGAITVEASRVLQGSPVTLVRLRQDGSEATVLAASGGHVEVAVTFSVPDDSIVGSAARICRPVRIDDYPIGSTEGAAGPVDIRAAVAVPVAIGNEPWGVMAGFSDDGILPPDAERWLSLFAEIGSAAISGWQAHGELRAMSEEQTALLRVAGLVARRASETELFEAVAEEASQLLDDVATVLARLDGDRTLRVVASHGESVPVGVSLEMAEQGHATGAEILRAMRPDRVDNSAHSSARANNRASGPGSRVTVPVIVGGRLWGTLWAVDESLPLPPWTEQRLEKFAEFVAAAIAANDARSSVEQLAEEQASLLRVAEAVARGMPLLDVFALIAREASNVLGQVATSLMQYDAQGVATSVSACRSPAPVGLQVPSDAHGIGDVFRTGRTIRVESFEETNLADVARTLGVLSGVAVPIAVEGRIWGTLTASSSGPSLAAEVEERLEKFASLAAVAIANAQNKEQLIASRARVQAAADEARRRVQRDVHDGAQQQLIQTVLALKMALAAAKRGGSAADLISEALGYAARATSELRDLVHGILPVSLSRGGLRAGLESLISDLAMPVQLDFDAPRCPSETEVTAYFVIAESLTNVVKHARANRIEVGVRIEGDRLIVTVVDDGIGGADPDRGSGMIGLSDRLQALGGELSFQSPPGEGTALRAALPIAVEQFGSESPQPNP